MPTLPNLSATGTTGPSGYSAAYGGIPAKTPLPSSIYTQVGNVLPSLPNLTSTAGNVIGSELKGELSPGTQNYISQLAAQYNVGGGMAGGNLPGSFGASNLVRSLGLASEDLSQAGLGHYNALLSTLGSQQLSPELQASIAAQNNMLAAAPNPQATTEAQLNTMKDLYLWQLQHTPQGGTGEFDVNKFVSNLGPGTTQSGPGVYHTPNQSSGVF